MMPFPPTPTAAYDRRRAISGPLPTILPRAGHLAARCEDCITKTITRTYYVDEQGQSTTCTTTQTNWQTFTTAPQPTPIPLPNASPVETVYHTITATIASSTPTPSTVWNPSVPPISSGSGFCDCGQQWAYTFLGGIPHGAAEIMASLCFFFPFLVFFLVALVRLKTYAGDKEMFFFLLPLSLFLAMMMSAMATRAYAANNESLPHYLAQYIMTALAVPLLMDVSLQLYGLLSKRAIPSGWIDASSLFLRFVNIIAVVLYAVAAASFVSFVNSVAAGRADCSPSSINKINIFNVVADILELLILIGTCICLFWAKWRLLMETSVIIIQYLITSAFFFHFTWRFLHDIHASTMWKHQIEAVCGQGSYSTAFDWTALRKIANTGMNGTPVYWLLGILPIFIATTLLMAANLVRYVTAVPEPNPEPDSVRYKLCYNEDTKKMEFQRLDNPGGPLLPSGEQLYELVRDRDGDGWAIQEARIPTVQPGWQNFTLSAWYR